VLTDGVRYVYRGTFEAEVGSDHVVGKASTRFTWDSTISATRIRLDTRDTYRPEIIRDVGVFYPERDPRSFGKWRDQVAVVVPQESGTEAIKIDELTITNTAGDVVRRITDPLGVASWNGRRANRDLVPKGLYTVEAAVSDPAGNASLKSPARAAWRGSIGLRSRATGPRCRELRAQTASTVFGITLPRTPLGDPDLYTHVRVATYGGGAPGTGYSYLVHWYWSRGKEWIERSQFAKRLRWHEGQRVGSNVVHGDPDKENSAIYWSVGLAEGANYDVKKFRVRIEYWDVR
jgi:hypothetical protein